MKNLAVLIIGLCVTMVTLAQAPQAFKYQAVARNADGSVIANQAVSFRISILRHNLTGDIVFSERHNTSTNDFGLATLEIGYGIFVTGSLSGIDWGADTYFIRVEMDPAGGTSYLVMGTSQLLSVPYALHAKTVEVDKVDDADHDPANEIQNLSLAGKDLTLSKGGGTITLPSTGDNWGTQTVSRDNSLGGNGTAASPLQVAEGGVTSAKIADNSIATGDLANNSVTSAKIADGTITNNDIADKGITSAKISSSGATANEVLVYNGTNVVWDRPYGVRLRTSVINVPNDGISTYSTTYVKVADLGTFSKMESGSFSEVTFNGRIAVASMTGTGAHFELRVDGSPPAMGRARALIRNREAGYDGVPVSITGIFTGLAAGSHTVSMWVKSTTGTGTSAAVDPGSFGDDHIVVAEYK